MGTAFEEQERFEQRRARLHEEVVPAAAHQLGHEHRDGAGALRRGQLAQVFEERSEELAVIGREHDELRRVESSRARRPLDELRPAARQIFQLHLFREHLHCAYVARERHREPQRLARHAIEPLQRHHDDREG